MLRQRYADALAVEDVQATFRANMDALGMPVDIIAEPSIVAAQRFEDNSVDRVFLDGSHDGSSVAADLVAWKRTLKPDGILAGHDYGERHVELREAVDAFAARERRTVRRGPRDIWWLE